MFLVHLESYAYNVPACYQPYVGSIGECSDQSGRSFSAVYEIRPELVSFDEPSGIEVVQNLSIRKQCSQNRRQVTDIQNLPLETWKSFDVFDFERVGYVVAGE